MFTRFQSAQAGKHCLQGVCADIPRHTSTTTTAFHGDDGDEDDNGGSGDDDNDDCCFNHSQNYHDYYMTTILAIILPDPSKHSRPENVAFDHHFHGSVNRTEAFAVLPACATSSKAHPQDTTHLLA